MIARLKPWAVALAVVLAVILALAAAHAVGLRWDPFGLAGRRLRAAEARADLAEDDAAARRLERAGEADQRARLDAHHQQTLAVARATERAAADARSAHDADLPLDPARASRLGEHDRGLCDLNPAVCAPAAPDPADPCDNAVPS